MPLPETFGTTWNLKSKKKTTTTTNHCICIRFIFYSLRYPSRYGLYLKDKPNTVVVPLEYEPEDKPISSGKGY